MKLKYLEIDRRYSHLESEIEIVVEQEKGVEHKFRLPANEETVHAVLQALLPRATEELSKLLESLTGATSDEKLSFEEKEPYLSTEENESEG